MRQEYILNTTSFTQCNVTLLPFKQKKLLNQHTTNTRITIEWVQKNRQPTWSNDTT